MLITLILRYFIRRTKQPLDPQDEMQMAAASESASRRASVALENGTYGGKVIQATESVVMRSPGRPNGPPTPTMKSERFKETTMHSIFHTEGVNNMTNNQLEDYGYTPDILNYGLEKQQQ